MKFDFRNPKHYLPGIFMIVLWGWGLILYPDGPISPCATGFCGKFGRVHTALEYNHFLIWEAVIISTYLLAGIAALFNWAKGSN